MPEQPQKNSTERHTYGEILKSTLFVGGSSAVNIAISVVRTKAMAILLGPSGFGLTGLYGSIANLAQSVAGMGVNSSGVRQIAEAIGSSDPERIAKTTTVLRRTSTVLGLLGAISLVALSRPVSTLTFGSTEHSAAVCLLSVAVFLQLVSAGQGALIQGMRRISDLAMMGVFSALFGTLIGVPLVYFLREDGVVPSLVAVALMSLGVSWWYSRKIHVHTISMTLSQMGREVAALLKLGSAFMASGLMIMGVAYVVRIIVLRELGFEATGLYQSAWTLGGLYAGFILQAMGADFYPRLTASAHDNASCNRLVNEQARVGLLLAGPGLLATLTFAPAVITVFYSAKFGAAVGVLRWICLGTTLQVISWPLGYIVVAKGRQGLFFSTELAWTLASLGLAWSCVKSYGLNGAGIAFFASYVFYGLIIYLAVRRISFFRWSSFNKRTGLFFFSLILAVFFGHYILPVVWALCLGTVMTLVGGAYSVRVLTTLVSWDRMPSGMRRMLDALRPVISGSTRV